MNKYERFKKLLLNQQEPLGVIEVFDLLLDYFEEEEVRNKLKMYFNFSITLFEDAYKYDQVQNLLNSKNK